MKNILSALAILLISTSVFGESEINAFLRLHSVEINEELYEPEKVKTTVIEVDRLSEIVEFGRIDDVMFGIRLEVHESRINDKKEHIIRRNFYYKKHGAKDWIKINSNLNTFRIFEASEKIDFDEIDKRGNHASFSTTQKIEDDYFSFEVIYDCVFQWK